MTPQIWTDEMKWEPHIHIDAASYMAWVKQVFPQLGDFTPCQPRNFKKELTLDIGGDKRVCVFKLPTTTMSRGPWGMGPEREVRVTLSTFTGNRKGTVSFSDEVLIPAIVDRWNDTWMSLTPMEVMSQRLGYKKAKGSVLVGGCGMGWFARKCLERKQVNHVTIVDLDKGVLDYFGGQLKKEFGLKLTLINDDIYNLDADKYDSYLSDIWPSTGGAECDKKFLRIAATHKNAWAWGQGWRSEVETMKWRISQERKAA